MAVRLCGTCRERRVLTDSNGGTVKGLKALRQALRFRESAPCGTEETVPHGLVAAQAGGASLRSRNQ